MSWTQYMLSEHQLLLERIYEHPFLKEIAAGTLPQEKLAFYFEQNVHYIDAAVRCRSISAAKAHNDEVRDFFLGPMALIVEELHHQEHMLGSLGAQFGAPIAPTCHAYTRHILTLAWSRDPVEYVGGFLPCPLSYDNIGLGFAQLELADDHADWWRFYMSEEHHQLCDNYRAFVDKHSANLSDERLQQMLDNFKIGLNYEYRFWDMAYNMETWPLS